MPDTYNPTATSAYIQAVDRLPGCPGRLVASSYPDVREAARSRAEGLFAHVRGSELVPRTVQVVDLTTETEREKKKMASYTEVLVAVAPGSERVSFEIEDRQPPRDFKSFRGLARRIADWLVAGRGVIVHCHGGHGRTGMVVAAVLALLTGERGARVLGEQFLESHRTREVGTRDGKPLAFPQCKAQRRVLQQLISPEFRKGGASALACTGKLPHDTAAFYSGPFSNWYLAPFVAELGDDKEYRLFSCVEQYMMAHKALLHNDAGALARIMEVDDPKTHKALGRKVKGYDEALWVSHRESVVATGIRHRLGLGEPGLLCSASAGLHRRELLMSGQAQVVEASPYDVIWGVGVNVKAALRGQRKEGALNLLGRCLEAVRSEIAANEGAADGEEGSPCTKRAKVC
jgi:ribA/ribD-fused uncharacterized protein